MGSITDEFNSKSYGGRLEQFRPFPKPGRDKFTNEEWAAEISKAARCKFSSKQLGVILGAKGSVTVPFVSAIAKWMKKVGHSADDILWWQIGGPRPKRETAKKNAITTRTIPLSTKHSPKQLTESTGNGWEGPGSIGAALLGAASMEGAFSGIWGWFPMLFGLGVGRL